MVMGAALTQRKQSDLEGSRFGACMLLRIMPFCAALWIFFALTARFVPAVEIDRLLAAVNGKVITQGDLNLWRSLNAVVFYDKSTAPASQENEIDRLVDQELMKQELKNFSVSQEDESRIQTRLQSLRDAYAEKGGLPLLLQQLGLQESELISYLQLESSIMKFVDFRFRPFVHVSEDEIKAYYKNRLALQLEKAKVFLPPLAEVSTRIEEILIEEKVNAALDQWIKEIRHNSRIEYFDAAHDSMTIEGAEP